QNQINSASQSLGNPAANAMYAAGPNFANGFTHGLNSQNIQLEKSAHTFANLTTPQRQQPFELIPLLPFRLR
ncbi:hypothetical protein OI75_15150, partial [Listeria monocytogenes]